MDALAVTGYDGPISLEIFNDRFRAGSAHSVAVDGHRSLIWLMDETARRYGRPIAGQVAMAPPAPVADVEFVEFAVDDSDLAKFETLLSAMGFAKVGRHRSKSVALWRQGDIRIVVNNDKHGFAHSYQVTHGASVCALALKVPDARATIARAEALLDTPHHGAVGPANSTSLRSGGSAAASSISLTIARSWGAGRRWISYRSRPRRRRIAASPPSITFRKPCSTRRC